ncbi:MAG TPA: hypothetical protein VMJ70_04360 [Candidatus Sulfotelmatobacter sp.]|nr:hypothetical protein [Candidatus Sulfotelmatobacter sp.]
MIGALLLSRARLARRALFSRPRADSSWLRHPLVAVGIAAWMGAFVYGGLRTVLRALSAAGAPPRELAGVLALALGAALVALLVFDVDDAVRTLMQDQDLELLRRAPIPPLALLGLKALDAVPRTLVPVLALAAPALLAFAGALRLSAAALPFGIAALLALWTLPLAAGAALALLVLRVAPAARARETLALMSTATLVAIWIVGAVWLPHGFAASPGSLASLHGLLDRALVAPTPGAMAARAFAAIAAGATGEALRELAGLALAALLAILAAALVAQSSLVPALERVASGVASKPRIRRASSNAAAGSTDSAAWPRDGAIAALVRRDARLLRRSWTLLGDLLVASTLWVLLPLVGISRFEIGWELLSRMMLLTISVGLGYEIAARSIPFERHLEYWSRVAPQPPVRWLMAKLLGSGLLALPVILLAGAVLEGVHPLSAGGAARALALVAGALPLSISSGLWAGLTFGDPEWINPRAMLRLPGRLATSGLLILQILFWLGIVFGIGRLSGRGEALAWAGLPLIGAGLATLPLLAGMRRLESPGWAH